MNGLADVAVGLAIAFVLIAADIFTGQRASTWLRKLLRMAG